MAAQVLMFDVVDREDYEHAHAAGHIRVQTHPTLPYLIHNYTDACTWDQAWTPATLACRGLITHADTGEVLARPFAKFFNHDQPGAPVIGLDDEVVVTDKADGSLAVLYPTPDGPAVATRGSFASEQAIWATDFYRRAYADRFTPHPAWTYLFEIVYPQNRIVIDYGDTEDLILLGAVHTATGRSIPVSEAADGWPGPVVSVFPHTTLREALAAPARSNAEGFVVWHPATDTRVKIKYEEYKRLHRFLTGVNERHVWEVLAQGHDPDLVFAEAPDEFHEWVRGVIAGLRERFSRTVAAAQAEHCTILSGLPDGWTRKDYAQAAARSPHRALLFLLLDGKDLAAPVWKTLRPAAMTTVRRTSGDAD